MEYDFNKLKAPFSANDIEWRIGRSGKNGDKIWATALAYVTNRAIMDRLDDVFGPGNWQNEYQKGPDGGTLCGISAKIDGGWVTKWDGAENTQFEAIKGGLSGAMKRAAVQWGPGRYLYNLEETFVKVVPKKGHNTKYQAANSKKGIPAFHWEIPLLPAWALPPINHAPETKLKGLNNKNVWADGIRDKYIMLCDENSMDKANQAALVGWYLEQSKVDFMTAEGSSYLVNNFADIYRDFMGRNNG